MSSIPQQQNWTGQNMEILLSNRLTENDIRQQAIKQNSYYKNSECGFFETIGNMFNSKCDTAWRASDEIPISVAPVDLRLTKDIANLPVPLDDILFGLDQDKHVGTNYYKEVGKCNYDPNYINCYNIVNSVSSGSGSGSSSGSSSSSDSGHKHLSKKEKCIQTYGSSIHTKSTKLPPEPNKYIFLRTIPKGNALTRMGLADKGVTTFGKVFSMVEDVMDIGKIIPDSNSNSGKSSSINKPIYINCKKKPFKHNTKSKIGGKYDNFKVRLYDKYNKDLTDTSLYNEFKQNGIEMFSNKNLNQNNTENKFISNIISSIFIILVLFLLLNHFKFK